jgi:tetratricopeptide (TPR) repeat protein
VAALLFAVHPVLTETVDYTSARSALLAAACVVWAFLAHLHAMGTRAPAARTGLVLLSLLLFALGLLSKEIAIVFPALLLWAAWMNGRGYVAALPALGVAALYLLLRRELLGAAVLDFAARAQAIAASDPGSGGARTIVDNLFTQARVVGAYVALFLWPRDLCVHRHVRESHTPFEPGVLLGLLVVAALAVTALRLRRRLPGAGVGLAWFLVALAPESSLIPLNQVMNEHRLYLPGVGLALAFAAVVRPRLVRPRPWTKPALAGAFVLLLALTLKRNEDWRDPLRLWSSAVRVSPESEGSWNSLGVYLRVGQRHDEAVAAFRKAHELNPHSWSPPFNMGTLHLDRGRATGSYDELQEAERWLKRSLAVRPGAERSRWYLAETHYAMGRIELAEAEFRALAGLSPRLFEMTRHALARIAIDRGRLDEAEGLLGEALRDGRDPVSARLGLADLELRRGREAEALLHARAAMEARPRAPEPHLFLARMHRGTALAVHHLFEAERRGYRPSAEERRDLLERKP